MESVKCKNSMKSLGSPTNKFLLQMKTSLDWLKSFNDFLTCDVTESRKYLLWEEL